MFQSCGIILNQDYIYINPVKQIICVMYDSSHILNLSIVGVYIRIHLKIVRERESKHTKNIVHHQTKPKIIKSDHKVIIVVPMCIIRSNQSAIALTSIIISL